MYIYIYTVQTIPVADPFVSILSCRSDGKPLRRQTGQARDLQSNLSSMAPWLRSLREPDHCDGWVTVNDGQLLKGYH